jgi:hypothetical protein
MTEANTQTATPTTLSSLSTSHSGRLLLAPSRRLSSSGRREYDVVVMRPGRVLRADGELSNWLIPAEAIRNATPLFDGVSSYLDHPELFGFGWRGEPEVKNLVGVIFDPAWDDAEQALVAGLRLYDQDPHSPGAFVGAILDQMLADQQAGLEVPPVGLSAVFYHRSRLDGGSGLRVTQEFRKVESVDLVYSAGAGGYVRSALSAMRALDTVGANPRVRPMPPIRPTFSGRSTERLKGVRTMPEESATTPPETSQARTGRARGSAIEALDLVSQQMGQMTARLEALEAQFAPAEGVGPRAHPDPQHAEDAQLSALSAQVDALTGLLAEWESRRTVQGMGQAPRSPRVSVGPTGLDQIAAAVDWIFGATDAQLPPPDLRRTDRIYYLLTGDGEWTGVFNERDALATANSSTLTGLAVNAMNKVIVPLYNRLEVYRWFERIALVQPTDGTLHDMAWIQFGGIGDLPIVAEGGAYTELTVGDSKESDAFVKYGGYVGITDKMLRNSEVAKLQAIPRALTIAAVQTRSSKIASIFAANAGVGPTLDQDSTALFHTNHGNLATTAFSWSAWKAARLECFKQTELTSSKRQGLWPKFWLGPADLYDDALTYFGYGAGAGGQPGTADNDVNPYAVDRPGDPRPIPIAVPDFTDTNDWAYIADPQIAPIIQMAYADNPGGRFHPPPQLYMVTSPTAGLMFSNDVLPIKVRDYFAYGVATYRGIGKRNVT